VNLVRAELLKALTTRLLLWYSLGLLAFLTLVLSTRIGSERRESLEQLSTQRSILEHAGLAPVFTVLLGAVLMTTEYAHGTINQSFLAVPKRAQLLAAKLAAIVLVALVFAALADGLTLLIAKLWYAGRGITFDLGADHVLVPLLGAVGASVVAAAIGVGLGALMRRQTAAVTTILVWLLIGEAAIGAIGDGARYAPGHALAAVVSAHTNGGGNTLGIWAAAATAVVYAAIFVVAGGFAMVGSDVPSSGD
jgi:ABC-2 type transport system permease protein